MVLMDTDISLGRAFEFYAWGSRCDLVDVEGASFLGGQSPQIGTKISRLGDVADDSLRTPHLMECLNEGFVVRIIERFKIFHACIGAGDVLATDAVDFVFSD